MKRRIRLPSPAMVVALLALLAATTGSAYAAVTISGKDVRNGSLTGRDIRSSSIRGGDIRNSSLASRDVKNGSLLAKDVKRGQLPATRWALINEAGAIEEQSGGFRILDAYVTNQNVYIDTGRSVAGRGLGATIAVQNMVDVDRAGGDPEPNFAGEVSAARCQVPGVVDCAPANSKNTSAIVVAPRNSDGSVTAAGARKRFYVTVTP